MSRCLLEFELMNRDDAFMELKHLVVGMLWKVSGMYIPQLLLTTSPQTGGADGAAGEKGDLGFILAGAGWSRASSDWIWAAKPL